MTPAAVIFDFNGTLSDDEQLLAELFHEIFAEVGIDVPAASTSTSSSATPTRRSAGGCWRGSAARTSTAWPSG